MAKKIAVFFGGQSFEHDVSILTGLQVIQVMDRSLYEPFPVYVDRRGQLWVGADLLSTMNYPIEERMVRLRRVALSVGDGGTLVTVGGLFRKKIKFDAAFLAFHGGPGESGAWSGAFAAAGIPFAGASVLASSVYMSKLVTKAVCRDLGINVLPETIVKKPVGDTDIASIVRKLDITYPVIVKPESLGSSVGVSRADNADQMASALLSIFKLNDNAMIELFVENLVEYNVAVLRRGGKIITSTIEMPNGGGQLLSFDDKYKGDGAKKKKVMSIDPMPSDNLIESRREFAPNITATQEEFIRGSASKLFETMGATGAPRIDFLCNAATGEIWLNEVNPIPGAFAFYLWRNSAHKISYADLTSIMLDNAFSDATAMEFDLSASGSKIFK